MFLIKFMISDLHIAGGHAILDGFSERQQSAFEGLLSAAMGQATTRVAPTGPGPLGDAEDVELIINGDCFDFLAVPPIRRMELLIRVQL